MKKYFIAIFLLFMQTASCYDYVQYKSNAIDGSGNSWTVTQCLSTVDNFTYTSSVHAVYTPFGAPSQAPIALSSPSLYSESPMIKVNSSGDAVAVWAAYDPSIDSRLLYVSTLIHGQSWSVPKSLSSYDESITSDFTVNISQSGNISVVWNSYLKEYAYTYSIANGNVNGTWNAVNRSSI